MSVSVSMPQLGESVTEGTVTRWLKHEGDHVAADEPLLEVSTDKVDTEIPSPVSGILRGITVAEDETVAVGAELAVIDEDGAAAGQAAAPSASAADAAAPGQAGGGYQQAEHQAPAAQAQPHGYQPQDQAPAYPAQGYQEQAYQGQGYQEQAYQGQGYQEQADQGQGYQEQADQGQGYQEQADQGQGYQEQGYQPQESYGGPPAPQPAAESGGYQPATGYEAPPSYADQAQPAAYQPYSEQPSSYQVPSPAASAPYQGAHEQTAPPAGYQQEPAAPSSAAGADSADSPYVTPLVRKLAAEHAVDLGAVVGTGVGGRIRKQDVLDAARQRRGGEAPGSAQAQPSQAQLSQAQLSQARPAQAQQPHGTAAPGSAGGAAAPAQAAPAAAGQPAAGGPPKAATIPPPSTLRGTTERLSRARQVIAQRMVESLQTSAQLTTVIEADVTAIARLRDRIKTAFEAREGVKLSFLPFFALATVEALKAHPRLNAIIDTSSGTVTYRDAEHLGIAVDTERGLMVPVIRNAGDLNIGGLARKIADLAQRTRAGQVSPDDLTGGTFTLTNTGSRGALFDTPIINQPQVGILGTGTVNKRAVVVDDPDLGEVITVRSIVYLALTYDHRLVDGADAARFLVTVKNRLEEGAFEAEFGR